MAEIPNLENSDWSLLAIAVDTLPGWMIGVIAGGGALTAILVMAMSALCGEVFFRRTSPCHKA